MVADLGAAISDAQDDLRRHADPTSAVGRKRYLKTPFEVLGCTVPTVRRAARTVTRSCRVPSRSALIPALDALWSSSVHDDRLLAIVLAAGYRDRFEAADVAAVFGAWLADCHTWDHTDALTTEVVGHITLRCPAAWPEIERWADDPWMWRRRAAILAHLLAIRRAEPQAERLHATCGRLIDKPEFFIRKAIGWALRELSATDPDLAERLVLELGDRASGLTLREATRRMAPAHRARILQALGRAAP